jgi:hypothetical protein
MHGHAPDRKAMVDGYMEHTLPMFPRRRNPRHDLDLAFLDQENVPELIGPGFSFLQRIGDFTTAEKNLLFADKRVPFKAAGHPYFIFQFQFGPPMK